MLRTFLAASALALAVTPAALPQSESQAAQSFVRYCVDDLRADGYRAPEAACGCGFGFMAARMTRRQMQIFSQMAPYLSDDQAMQSVVANMVQNQGVQAQEVIDVGTLLERLGNELDPFCTPLER
ncbi:hypothetical protein V0U79_08850 [Hyphobacterium sp. HN65]|uniref:Rap1a immunity protein domain-containing protein n=1 Tax=Hyphobacterium lacteum TaxID=3116575 RepID=A0ABU7LRE0_9PROT|nr:hypothetical protein [Hyphobacterium sp. HN65]MEE2526474.1 hypothetical protein [Hyphobacterium sp. HN65]